MRVLFNARIAKIMVAIVGLLSLVGSQNMANATSKVVKEARSKDEHRQRKDEVGE